MSFFFSVVVYYMRAQAKAQISANEMIREQLKQVMFVLVSFLRQLKGYGYLDR